jgi:hypothetical protein
MGIREFLRGGYQHLTEGTVVMRHNHTLFTVVPFRAVRVREVSRETPENAPETPPDGAEMASEPHETAHNRTQTAHDL